VKLRLLAVGTKGPTWVAEAFADYNRRLPPAERLELLEIPAPSRRGGSLERALAEEGTRMLSRIGAVDHVVALDVMGRTCSTEALAAMLDDWRMRGNDVSFLIGGADGLHGSCRERANDVLSLSALTFPHHLVRVILVEQLYRAWTLLHGHPYHRA